MNDKDLKTHYEEWNNAWQKLSDNAREHWIVDVVLAVRDGYSRELNLERAALGNKVSVAVAEERKRCAAVARDFLAKGRSPLGKAVAEAILKG